MAQKVFLDFWLTLWCPDISDLDAEKTSLEAIALGLLSSKAQSKLAIRKFEGGFFPGALTLLCSLSQIAELIIVSHSPQEFMEDVLKKWNVFTHFSHVISTKVGGGSKEKTISALLEDEKRALFIADSMSDGRVARDLGIDFIHFGPRSFLDPSLPCVFSTQDMFRLIRYILRHYFGQKEIEFVGSFSSNTKIREDIPYFEIPSKLRNLS